MAARVFISHRPQDAAGATALAGELDGMFGDGQIARLAADAASTAQWRDALAGGPGDPPLLLALVTAAPPAAADAPADDAGLRAELDAGLAAGILVLPLLGEGDGHRLAVSRAMADENARSHGTSLLRSSVPPRRVTRRARPAASLAEAIVRYKRFARMDRQTASCTVVS